MGDVVKLSAPSDGDGITVTSIKVATGTKDSNISLVKLIDDKDGNGTYEPLQGEQIIATSTVLSDGTVQLNPADGIFIEPSKTRSILVAFDIADTATVGATIKTSIAYNTDQALSDIKVAAPDSIISSGTLTGATLTIKDKPDIVTVSQPSLVGDGEVRRSSDDNPIQIINLSTDDRATVDSVTIKRTGTAVNTDIKDNGVKLWLDNDKSGDVSNGDIQLSTSKTFTGTTGTITFDNIGLEVSYLESKQLLVTYSISATAVPGHTIINEVTAVGVVAPDTSSLSGSLVSSTQTITYSADKLTVTNNPPTTNLNPEQGSQNVVGDVLRLHASTGDNITVTTVKVDTGLTTDSNVKLVKLIHDKDGNGQFNSGDVIIASTTSASGVAQFNSLNFEVASDTTQTILVAFDISNTAKVGDTIKTSIVYDPDPALSGIQVAAPDIINGSGALIGATLTIEDKPDTLIVDQSPVDGGDVVIGSSDHVMQMLDLSVIEDKVTLTSLIIKRTGTAMDGDTTIDSIKLWFDADNNGLLSTKDWQLSTSKTFRNGIVTFDNIKLAEITPESPKKLLVTYSISSDAVVDRDIGSSIESTASVGVAWPDNVELASTPLASKLHVIAPEPPTAPTGLKITAGSNNQFILDWNDNPANERVTAYNVYRSTESDGTFSLVGTSMISQHTDTVPATGSYWYKVSAINRSGMGAKSAAETAKSVDASVMIDSASTTTTIESADASIKLIVPPSTKYLNKTFTIKSATRPAGIRIASRYYFEFQIKDATGRVITDTLEPFSPALILILKCNNQVDDKVVIYHYNDLNKWEAVTGGKYIYSDHDIGYTNITKFSGYAAAEPSFGGYNYPLDYTDKPKGPHGSYTSTTNKCKDCHAVHLATGSYRLTRANTRGETCEFCHGIGGAASTTVILDPEGHGLYPYEAQGIITAPDDTNPSYSKNAQLWGCLECHSAHDNQTVKLAGLDSSKLLKADPNPGKNYLYYRPVIGETTQTVTQWCSACHNANFGASTEGKTVLKGSVEATVFGHPSSNTGTIRTPDGYAEVKLDDGLNRGPTCKECHIADGRAGTSEFPHSSGSSPSMLKAGSDESHIDGICAGCHNTASLP
ncbi:MAG: hypothetical protein IBX64_11220 [Actinobacteria bacterium]|nr:hypothetical protein [Actinomycetota bacterium]